VADYRTVKAGFGAKRDAFILGLQLQY